MAYSSWPVCEYGGWGEDGGARGDTVSKSIMVMGLSFRPTALIGMLYSCDP